MQDFATIHNIKISTHQLQLFILAPCNQLWQPLIYAIPITYHIYYTYLHIIYDIPIRYLHIIIIIINIILPAHIIPYNTHHIIITYIIIIPITDHSRSHDPPSTQHLDQKWRPRTSWTARWTLRAATAPLMASCTARWPTACDVAI